MTDDKKALAFYEKVFGFTHGAEDMGPQDAAVGQCRVDIGAGDLPGALRDGPPGGAVILRLHGTEPAHHSGRGGPGRRTMQPLVAQTLANNIRRGIHRGRW